MELCMVPFRARLSTSAVPCGPWLDRVNSVHFSGKDSKERVMSQLIQDLRFAVRNLSQQPGLALAAILTLALGIGVNSAIFSIVDSILLTPPPFREPDRVILAWASNPALGSTEGMGTKGPASDAAFYDFQRSAHSFEKMAMMQANRRVLTGQGEPELLGATIVTGE